MKIWLATFLCLAAMGASHNTHAQGIGFSGFSGIGKPGFSLNGSPIVGPPPVTQAPVSIMPPQVVGLDYPNNGVSTALTGTTLTLTADDGQWSNFPTTLSRAWHTINAPATPLGTGSTLTIDIAATPAIVGQAIELNTTATNAIGSTTQMSHWFGPIEAAAPAQPVPSYEDKTQDFGNGVGNPPSTISLPISPVHFLQNGHAVYPGCNIPPVGPNTTPTNVWYFDPIGGRTQAQMTSNSDLRGPVAAIDQGHIGHPFLDISALFNTVSGYPSGGLFGFSKTIHPGDTIYIKPGDATHPIGQFNSTSFPEYSTSDGTTNGTIAWTWILPDPAAATPPVFTNITLGSGNGGIAGFIFKGLNVESVFTTNLIKIGGGITTPIHDVIFEGVSTNSWLGHSTDPWLVSPYPSTNGTSDGTIVTASPLAVNENQIVRSVSAPANSTTLTVTDAIPPLGDYVWSPGIFASSNPFPQGPATGIPNGSKVASLNGLTSFTYNLIQASRILLTDLTSLPQIAGSPFASVTAMNAVTGDASHSAVVRTSTTAVQTVYTWNTGTSAWVSIGTLLPVTSTAPTNEVAELFLADGIHVAYWAGAPTTGGPWVDQGLMNIQIAPCSPSTDASTGCVLGGSYTSVPGCDPNTNLGGGPCPAGTPYLGTTRQMGTSTTTEKVTFTERMLTLPAGYWTSWDWGSATGINISGQRDDANSQVPAQPNLYKGATCISLKDNMVRNASSGIGFGQVTNSIAYNNRVKWFSADGYDVYSVHRVWMVHNWASDNTQVWAHQDGMQFAAFGAQTTTTFHPINYSAAAIENELIQQTDMGNYFARSMQGISNTDNVWWGEYLATNVILSTTSGTSTSGKYNVVVNNDQIAASILMGEQKKTGDSTPVYGVFANNIGNGTGRGLFVANACDPPPAGDMVTVAGNLSIPFHYLPIGSINNTSDYCTVGVPGGLVPNTNPGDLSNTIPGGHIGQAAWTQTDYRSDVSGVSSLFTAFHPLNSPFWTPQGLPQTTPCVRGTFFTTLGSCSPDGVLDLAPNKTFARTTTTILGNYNNVGSLPHAGDTGGTVGDAYVAGGETCPPGQTAFCGASGTVWPAGVYIRDTPSAGNSTQWRNLGTVANPAVPPFIPGIAGLGAPLGSLTVAGGGASLGPQTPISDHDGYGWANPPSMGAYEVVGSLPFQCAHPGLQFNDACNAIHLDMKRE